MDDVPQDGNVEEMFRHLYVSQRGSLIGFFRGKGLSQAVSEELTQETFLRVYRRWRQSRAPKRPRSYLYTVATNIWRNHIRGALTAKRSGVVLSIEDADMDPADTSSSVGATRREVEPSSALVDHERRATLLDAIERLPDQMRKCMVLRVYQERSVREISSILGIAEGTVKAHLHHAKVRLISTLSGGDTVGDPQEERQ